MVVHEGAGEAELGVAGSTSQVHGSACSGVRTDGLVQPRVFLTNRKVCSMSKRA